MSVLNMFSLSFSFMSIWGTIIITILMSPSSNSSSCVNSRLVLIDSFSPHYDLCFSASFHVWYIFVACHTLNFTFV